MKALGYALLAAGVLLLVFGVNSVPFGEFRRFTLLYRVPHRPYAGAPDRGRRRVYRGPGHGETRLAFSHATPPAKTPFWAPGIYLYSGINFPL